MSQTTNTVPATPEQEKKRGLRLPEIYCLGLGQVIGAGIITLVGPAIALTGYSAWLGYFLAIILGFISILPVVFVTGTVRLTGGFYSLISGFCGKRVAGMYAFAQLTKLLNISLFGVSLGTYLHSMYPQLNPTAVGFLFLTLFYILNLCGVNIMAKIQKYMTWTLIAALIMFTISGFFHFNNNVFDIKDPNFMIDGSKGLIASMFLFVFSTSGYSNVMNYGLSAEHPTKDIPRAVILCGLSLIVLYCGVAIAAACSVPMDQIAGQPLTVVALHNLPGPLYVLFMIGGPIMALMTTLNAVIPSNCFPVMIACEDNWLPKSLGRKNKHGAPWIIMTINYILGVTPILLGFSITTITKNITLLTSMLSFIYCYAYFKLPTRYKNAWEKSKYHVPNGVYYAICAVCVAAQVIIFYKSAQSLTPVIAAVSIGATLVCVIAGALRSRNPNVKIRPQIFDD